MKTFKTPKGTELPMLDLRGKDYLQVAHRLVWFREQCPLWTIKTDVQADFEKQRCLATAWIIDDKGTTIAMGHKVEDAKGFADFVEKSETGAVGRALAMCGYGTQFAPDLDEGERIVDAPLPKKYSPPQTNIASVAFKPPTDELSIPQGKSKLAGMPLSKLNYDQMANTLGYWERTMSDQGKTIEQAPTQWVPVLLEMRRILDSPEQNEGPLGDAPPPLTDEDVPF